MKKQPLAEKMLELTASAKFRKCIAEMNKMQRQFSEVRHVYISNPSEQTIEMLRAELFKVERTKITEYTQYKVSW